MSPDLQTHPRYLSNFRKELMLSSRFCGTCSTKIIVPITIILFIIHTSFEFLSSSNTASIIDRNERPTVNTEKCTFVLNETKIIAIYPNMTIQIPGKCKECECTRDGDLLRSSCHDCESELKHKNQNCTVYKLKYNQQQTDIKSFPACCLHQLCFKKADDT